jgi:transcriptional regulator with XRE-family HTH domain
MGTKNSALTAEGKKRKAKRLIKESGLSYEKIGALLGVTGGAVDHWAAGRNGPSVANLNRLEAIVKGEASSSAPQQPSKDKGPGNARVMGQIRRLRSAGMTLREIGAVVGASANAVGAWGRGNRVPRKSFRTRLNRLYKKTVEAAKTAGQASAPVPQVSKPRNAKGARNRLAARIQELTTDAEAKEIRAQRFREQAKELESDSLVIRDKINELQSVFDLLHDAGVSGFE